MPDHASATGPRLTGRNLAGTGPGRARLGTTRRGRAGRKGAALDLSRPCVSLVSEKLDTDTSATY